MFMRKNSKNKSRGGGRDTALFVVLGVLLAVGLNHGMSIVMATDYPIVAVESNSMIPVFYRGDILLIKGVTPETLKTGDIMVFSVPGRQTPIVHRVISINGDGTYQTKGDANQGQHPWETSIQFSQIKGKEILIVPLLGWVKIGITEIVVPNILFFVLIVAALAFIYMITNKKKPASRLNRSKQIANQLEFQLDTDLIQLVRIGVVPLRSVSISF